MISVEETWLVAHVRAQLVALCESGEVSVPEGVEDLRDWARAVEVHRILMVRDYVWSEYGREKRLAELVARVVLTSRDYRDFPLEWQVVLQQALMYKDSGRELG